MRRITLGTLTAALAFVLAAPIHAVEAPSVPPPGIDIDLITSEVPVPPPSGALMECEESGFCPPSYTNDDGQTCPLQGGIAVVAGARFRLGPFTVTVIVGGYICDYGECGVISGGFAIIIVTL